MGAHRLALDEIMWTGGHFFLCDRPELAVSRTSSGRSENADRELNQANIETEVGMSVTMQRRNGEIGAENVN